MQIAGYPDYLIFKNGEVFSKRTLKFLKKSKVSNGYFSVELFNQNGSKRFLIHRLVAQAFIPNPCNLPQVNHKDENKENNSVENLEWCTAYYNRLMGHCKKDEGKTLIIQKKFTK